VPRISAHRSAEFSRNLEESGRVNIARNRVQSMPSCQDPAARTAESPEFMRLRAAAGLHSSHAFCDASGTGDTPMRRIALLLMVPLMCCCS
jgi:hypothetical protein